MNLIALLLKNGSLKLDEKLRKVVTEKIKKIWRIEHVLKYLSLFEISVEDSYCTELTQNHLDTGEYVQAIRCIKAF